MTCINLTGKYNCSCPDGYEGDGMKDGAGCNPIPVPDHRLPLINIALGIRISRSMLLVCCSWLYLVFRQRKIIDLREKFFQQCCNNVPNVKDQFCRLKSLLQMISRRQQTTTKVES
ncbi:hypothetical protein CsSME_00014772 [Camellia sinensis var. sinensis]